MDVLSYDDLAGNDVPVDPKEERKEKKKRINVKDNVKDKEDKVIITSETTNEKITHTHTVTSEQKDNKIETTKGKGMIPIPKADRLQWNDGINWLDSLTPTQWGYIQIYMYRLYPEIDITPRYIDIYTGTENGKDSNFTREGIISKHGGGMFQFVIQDTSISPVKKIVEIMLDIPLSEAEPILDYRTLKLDSKKNGGYIKTLKSKGVLDIDGNPVKKIDPEASLTERLLNENKQLTDRLISTVTAVSTPKRDPIEESTIAASMKAVTSTFDMLLEKARSNSLGPVEMIQLMNEMNKRKDNGEMGQMEFLKILMDMQRSHNESMTKMYEKMMVKNEENNQREPKEDEASSLLGAIEKLKAFGIEVGPAKKSSVDVLLEKLPEMLGPTLQMIAGFLIQRSQQQPIPQPIQQQQPINSQYQPNAQQSQPVRPNVNEFILPSANQPVNPNNNSVNTSQTLVIQPEIVSGGNVGNGGNMQTQINAQNAEEEMKKAEMMQLVMILNNFHDRVYAAIIEGIETDDMKLSGQNFAASIETLAGENTRLSLQMVDTEKMLDAMGKVPVFWVKVQNIKDKVVEFIEGFKSYGNEVTDDGEEDNNDDRRRGAEDDDDEVSA